MRMQFTHTGAAAVQPREMLPLPVVAYLNGGIGNQLFQLAAASAYAKRFNRPLALYFSKGSAPHGIEPRLMERVFGSVPEFKPPLPSSAYVVNAREHEKDEYTPLSPFAAVAGHVDNPRAVLLLQGYFQHMGHLEPGLDEVCDTVLAFLAPSTIPDMGSTLVELGAVFMHVRRGDFLTIPNLCVDLDEYYRSALQLFPADAPIYLLSDDIPYCANVLMPSPLLRDRRCILVDKSPMECLRVMSECSRGGICANSTLSWWGGALGARRFGGRNASYCYFTVPRTGHLRPGCANQGRIDHPMAVVI